MDYHEMRRKIIQFINDSGINAYEVCRISKDLCCCRTCKFFVQHYAKDGAAVDFGHCTKNNIIKSKKPNMQSCGFWTLDEKNGVILPPCKVGDTVYFSCLDENCEKFIDKGRVYAISQNENTLWFSVRYLSGLRYDHTASDFGKTVFLTREDAEQALKERENNA